MSNEEIHTNKPDGSAPKSATDRAREGVARHHHASALAEAAATGDVTSAAGQLAAKIAAADNAVNDYQKLIDEEKARGLITDKGLAQFKQPHKEAAAATIDKLLEPLEAQGVKLAEQYNAIQDPAPDQINVEDRVLLDYYKGTSGEERSRIIASMLRGDPDTRSLAGALLKAPVWTGALTEGTRAKLAEKYTPVDIVEKRETLLQRSRANHQHRLILKSIKSKLDLI